MTFSQFVSTINEDALYHSVGCTANENIPVILEKQYLDYQDFLALLSPAAGPYLDKMIERARKMTRDQFGNTVRLYVPLYLSNECINSCVYCGFNHGKKIRRKTLNKEELLKELTILKKIGFQHILLLTGDKAEVAGADYVTEAIKLTSEYFPYISLEIFAATAEEYSKFAAAGANGLTIYQETYHKPTYKTMHLKGPKKDYLWRLDSPDRALSAGIRKIGIGALLGLYDWRYEMALVGAHAYYLAKQYWRAELSVSFPRLRDISGKLFQTYQVDDKSLVRIITAFRLFLPWIDLVLSTRESASLRDQLVGIGITQISAESRTNPGGYNQSDSSEQFSVADNRSLEEVKIMLAQKGFDPVLKDWSYELQGNSV
ncbi:MAG: 2-iminoacetate synthase ThiH [Candidatus Margulisiibacteriota bacterium]|nr:MAG: thiamine biosynthesis protein ThiH [Candidatus Margulisbacteria bacterium GWD2_39_127]OGI00882.1 MAG: thiamine biosynthesis protein ThiH [Candidatus Margulisbacteria bacterium GWF2_38_17]OGI08737.1 MAG: thiamine biosynthesis protein ThiH [Candidatus Margulisbacteria bacterium GWE2_39_32]PZM79448.1 MAG: 2-iminoacetate synthase ThiH [Candidatus Margulisiibacteriota bacterium]HAR63498.1 2-iminoacetate synthase ThiH [Candidatus Margulisiibacteriota bacterium]